MEENGEAKKILKKIWGKKNILQFKILWLFFNQRDYQTSIIKLIEKFDKTDPTVRGVINEFIRLAVLRNILGKIILNEKNSLTIAIFDFFEKICCIEEGTADEIKIIEKRQKGLSEEVKITRG